MPLMLQMRRYKLLISFWPTVLLTEAYRIPSSGKTLWFALVTLSLRSLNRYTNEEIKSNVWNFHYHELALYWQMCIGFSGEERTGEGICGRTENRNIRFIFLQDFKTSASFWSFSTEKDLLSLPFEDLNGKTTSLRAVLGSSLRPFVLMVLRHYGWWDSLFYAILASSSTLLSFLLFFFVSLLLLSSLLSRLLLCKFWFMIQCALQEGNGYCLKVSPSYGETVRLHLLSFPIYSFCSPRGIGLIAVGNGTTEMARQFKEQYEINGMHFLASSFSPSTSHYHPCSATCFFFWRVLSA